MRLAVTLISCMLACPAFAAECSRWSASMEEDEGGPQMTAQICAQASSSTPEAQHLFFVTCLDGSLSMRFLPFGADNFPPGGNEEFKTDVELSMDQETFTLPAQFESMDGAMVFAAKAGAPMFDVMMNQKEFTLSDPEGKMPGATFTLKGSRQALQKVIGSCSK